MKMVFRWFPHGDDSVTLPQIRQIPGVQGVVPMLPRIPVGEAWPLQELEAIKAEIEGNGLTMEVIESVNIHEDIKKGLPGRDRYIENYQTTLRTLQRVGVKCLCYNFMPVMDWARSELFHPLSDGSSAMYYNHQAVLERNPAMLAERMLGDSGGYSMPGWEPQRMPAMSADIAFYQTITQEDYWRNLKYFLDAVIPVAEQCDIKMAIHPDDPPFSIFGLPKVINSREHIEQFLALNDSPYNGLTFCTGSLGADRTNDLPAMLREFSGRGRVHFAHIRNIRHDTETDFYETAHPSSQGDLDMYAIVKALYDTGFDGYVRPDHGRMIWGEQGRPGYGLYDRALGVTYLLGLWEAIDKTTRG